MATKLVHSITAAEGPIKGFATADSTSTTSGGAIFSGGVGIAKNLNLGGVFRHTTVWDDMTVSASSLNVGSSIKPPPYTKLADTGSGSDGVFSFAFEEGKTQDLLISTQLTHKYKEGTDLHPHMHISVPTHEADKLIQFSFEYFLVSVGSPYTVSKVITSVPLVCPAAKTHSILPLPAISGAGVTISAILTGRLVRDIVALNSYTGAVNLLSFDLHIETDSLGSQFAYVK